MSVNLSLEGATNLNNDPVLQDDFHVHPLHQVVPHLHLKVALHLALDDFLGQFPGGDLIELLEELVFLLQKLIFFAVYLGADVIDVPLRFRTKRLDRSPFHFIDGTFALKFQLLDLHVHLAQGVLELLGGFFLEPGRDNGLDVDVTFERERVHGRLHGCPGILP